LALARERREAMVSVMQRTDSSAGPSLAELIADLTKRLNGDKHWAHASTARARYVGQGHELDVPVPADATLEACGSAFEAMHEALFGYRLERPVEIVSVRHAVSGSERSVWLDNEPVPGTVVGPASRALSDATLFVAPGWQASTLPTGGWMLERFP
jgi:N-methylhydantoinase A